jgi:enoyl-CoA hydratase/carnithine racemase
VAEVERERRGAVEILRINRPEARNALNTAVIDGLGIGIYEAELDPEVGAIVITGSGDRAFCAGMDLREYSANISTDQRDNSAGADMYSRFINQRTQKPVIAAANGSAVAGGFILLLACHLAVAAPDARFGVPEVKRALFPAGGFILMTQRLPLAMVYELSLTGDLIDAERALALGIINRIVPTDQVIEEAIALAERIADSDP